MIMRKMSKQTGINNIKNGHEMAGCQDFGLETKHLWKKEVDIIMIVSIMINIKGFGGMILKTYNNGAN